MGSTVVMGGFFDELFIASQVGRGANLDWRFLTRPFFGRNEDVKRCHVMAWKGLDWDSLFRNRQKSLHLE